MGFFQKLFESKQTKINKSHLQSMFLLAIADGNLADEEKDHIEVVARGLGITIGELLNPSCGL